MGFFRIPLKCKKIRHPHGYLIFWLGNKNLSNFFPNHRFGEIWRTLLLASLVIWDSVASRQNTSYIKRKIHPPIYGGCIFGWGIGIRTPTGRVRVCSATITQFPNICGLRKYIIHKFPYLSTAKIKKRKIKYRY